MKKLLVILTIIATLLPSVTFAQFSVFQGGTGVNTIPAGLIRGNGTADISTITTSSGISGVLSDETGSGAAVFGTLPSFLGGLTGNGATSAGFWRWLEDTDNGSNYWQLSGPTSLASNVTCAIDASGQIPDSCVGNGTDDDSATLSVGSAGAIQVSDGSGAFLGSDVANFYYDAGGSLLYLLDETTTYHKAGDYATAFNFDANSITASTTRTYTGPDLDGTLALTAGAQTFTDKNIDSDTNTLSVDPDELKSGVDSPADEECYTYESTGTTGEWQTCGGTPTFITVADTTDATSFVGLFESATGDLAPKTDGGLLYDASNGTLSSTIFNTPTLTLTGTGTLNGLDAIDATGEATLEATLDIAGDVTGTGLGAVTIAANSVALTTDTTGNYVSSATASGGLTLTGTEGGSLGILLPAATDALSATTSSGSGLELLSGGLTLLQGCSDGQVLAWAEATDLWACSSAGGGSGDITSVGDVASGAAFDGTQGTILTFNDADGDKTIEYDNTNNQFEVNANWLPSTNDGASLGSATQSFSDLFLASGAVANWNNGDMTLTHSSNALRFGGGVVSFSDAAPTAVTGTERVIFEDADGALSDWSFRVGGEGSGLIAFAAGDGTLASPALKDEFDNLGEIAFYGHDGTNYEKTASIYAYAGTGTTGNNDMPSTLAFRTTPDGSNTMVTAVQINQAGALLANSGADNVMYDCVELGLDPYSNITTGTDKDSLVMPYAMTVTNVYASLTTGPTGSVATFDINEAGTSIISTKITIDASETSSQTAATAAVISDSAIAKGSKLSFDIDGVGSTTPGNGVHLQVCGPINY